MPVFNASTEPRRFSKPPPSDRQNRMFSALEFLLKSDKKNPFFMDFRMKYLIDDQKIFKAFHAKQFFQYMNEYYRFLPFLFDPTILMKFRTEFKTNQQYQAHVLNWFQMKIPERQEFLKSIPQNEYMNEKRLMVLLPFVELLLDFLYKNNTKEIETSQALSSLTDLRVPHQWYPLARKMKRTIIYHAGPTNSGKTYHALKEFEKADKGLYCAPLRLLAWEIQEKMETIGLPCNLFTGQEKIVREKAKLTSCTVEKADLNTVYDVAIIDEIQMIGDQERGSGWTNALLGLQAEKIHVCGDPRALALVSKLCELTNDELIVKKYERLSTLYISKKNFHLGDLREGDCIITFSSKGVHSFKNRINKLQSSDMSPVAVVYGKLPPEARKDQARKFNNRDSNVKFLVATNAIGMGLNLRIKRVIFQSLVRMNSMGRHITIDDSEIKQIAGRAGRFKEDGMVMTMNKMDHNTIVKAMKNSPNVSIVEANEIPLTPPPKPSTTVELKARMSSVNKKKRFVEDPSEEEDESNEKADLKSEFSELKGSFSQSIVDIQEKQAREFMNPDLSDDEESAIQNKKKSFSREEMKITQAGIFPAFAQLEVFAKHLKNVEKDRKLRLLYVFKTFVGFSQVEGLYFIQLYDQFCNLAEIIGRFDMELKDEYIWASAPVNISEVWKNVLICYKEFAFQFSNEKKVTLPKKINLELEGFTADNVPYTLPELEEVHHILDGYLWLSNKYESIFVDAKIAQEKKDNVCKLIGELLERC